MNKIQVFSCLYFANFFAVQKMQFVDTNLTDKNPADTCHINPVHVLNKAILSQLWINKA